MSEATENRKFTVGELKEFLERFEVPDDATVLMESDGYDTENPYIEVDAFGAKVEVWSTGRAYLCILHPPLR